MSTNNEPVYLTQTIIIREYNPNYGDLRICKCGDAYYLHFNRRESMGNMLACECECCDCMNFVEQDDKDE